MEMKKINDPRHSTKYDYYATDDGRIWSSYTKNFLKPAKDKDGYLKVRLMSNDLPSGRWFTSVHRLVLQTFKPIENMAELQVNHIDGNKENNAVSNLEWVTLKENIHHACEHNLRARVNGAAKLTEQQVIEIYNYIQNTNITNVKLGEMYGVDPDCIGRIRTGKSWRRVIEDYNNQ